MVTLEQIINRYGLPIKRSIRVQIESYINEDIIQRWIQKALEYQLTDADRDAIFKVGRQQGKYPCLYYLCCIYIHSLTKCQAVVTELSKLGFSWK